MLGLPYDSKGPSWIHCSRDFGHALFPGFEQLQEQRNIVLQMLWLATSASRREEPAHQHVWAPTYQPLASKMVWGERNTVLWDASFSVSWLAGQLLLYLAFWLIFSKVKKAIGITFKWVETSGFLLVTPQVLRVSHVVSKKWPVLQKALFSADSLFRHGAGGLGWALVC